jgi:hypothetical protein
MLPAAATLLPACLAAFPQSPKSSSAESCLAPPGMGYYTRGLLAGFAAPEHDESSQPATLPCPIGFYKSGWNREECQPCGLNVLTPAAGSDSSDACYIPAGWGSKAVSGDNGTTIAAFKCVNGTFGVSTPHFGLAPAPCQVMPSVCMSMLVACCLVLMA